MNTSRRDFLKGTVAAGACAAAAAVVGVPLASAAYQAGDVVEVSGVRHIVFSNATFSWAIDEVVEVVGPGNVMFYRCVFQPEKRKRPFTRADLNAIWRQQRSAR